MLITTATIVRREKRMNSDIQIIGTLSDDLVDCSPIWSPGDEFMDTVFITVIALGVADMVTTLLMVAVLFTDCTSVLVLVVMVVDVELMICKLVTTDVVVSITAQESVRVQCSIRQYSWTHWYAIIWKILVAKYVRSRQGLQ